MLSRQGQKLGLSLQTFLPLQLSFIINQFDGIPRAMTFLFLQQIIQFIDFFLQFTNVVLEIFFMKYWVYIFEVLIYNQCSIWYCAGTKRVFKHMRIIWVFVQPCILLLLIFTSAGRYCLVLLRIMICFWNLN